MNLLSTELTRSIRLLKTYHLMQQRMMTLFRKLLPSKTLDADVSFFKAFKRALSHHVTGEIFSEKTITNLFTVFNEFYRSNQLSKPLKKLLIRTKPLVDELYEQTEQEVELAKMKASYQPLQVHSQNLQFQLRRLISENLDLLKKNELAKESLKAQKKLNASLEMRMSTLEQEARILRIQNGCLNRLLRAFKNYLGLTLTTISPTLYEKVKQLYLFKDEASSFEEVSRNIEKELKELLNQFQAEMIVEDLTDESGPVEEIDMTETQQVLLEQLSAIWNSISEEAEREQAFCAIVKTIKCMFDSKQQNFDLNLLYKMSPTLQRRYFVLKEGLYKSKQISEFNTKPFFSTKDAVNKVNTSLIESKAAEKYVTVYEKENPGDRSSMSRLLDEFFEVIKQLLVTHHVELHEGAVNVEEEPSQRVIAAAPAA